MERSVGRIEGKLDRLLNEFDRLSEDTDERLRKIESKQAADHGVMVAIGAAIAGIGAIFVAAIEPILGWFKKL